ncbi:multicopper oxidase [Colletotrichum karsti]|uniref:Multicopper oxidase n=1 Tax=Colletotrichum karsti TaxID=1095194 RepID=A0A9P6I7E5_9PEZI|nr:multicopper oxidase [Colletotrichum karsti]KAF9878648.1 multicopper oxidase [Colletotrichum karsti]
MFFRTSHVVAAMALFEGSLAKDWLSPEYKFFYQFPLPIPPVKQPKFQVTNPVTNKPIDYYEIDVLPFKKQVYPDRGPASLVGYDGMSPGPTFLVPRGRETVVRFTNKAVTPSAVHLHGSYSRAPWDGWAEDLIRPGQYKDYYYPNSQSGRFLWYHDHAVDITAVNAYFGQAGAYIIQDPAEDALGLPRTYGVDDIPLMLSSKIYKPDGSLLSPAGETDSLYGDVIHVNGQPWPFFEVEPRKYRLRFLNSAVSRSFILYFRRQTGAAEDLPFQVIASDAGLLTNPVNSTTLTMSMAERWEIIFDFSRFAGQNVTLRNQDDVGKDKDYAFTNQVMRFVVGAKTTAVDNTLVPAKLRDVPFPSRGPGLAAVDRKFEFHRQNGLWKINGVGFSDVRNRILAKVPLGTVEVWEFENSGGGWTHPIHVHLVDFRILSRTKKGRGVLPYEAAGLKDVVWLDAGETVRVEAHYAPWDGVYMFHCHNLIHEDHEMMAAFNVTALADFGYHETSFADPMESRWRAVPVNVAAFTREVITKKVQFMASLQPYNNAEDVLRRLDAYWAARGGAKMRRVKRAEQ